MFREKICKECCEACSLISILKPQIVIEERKWCPYPMVVRHYIDKPKLGILNRLKTWYNKCKEDIKKERQIRNDKKLSLEARERKDRERCLKELHRLHSYHQSLYNKSQSCPTFSKNTKNTEVTKSKIKRKAKSLSPRRHKEKKKKKCNEDVNMLQAVCNCICCIAFLAVVGFGVFLFM